MWKGCGRESRGEKSREIEVAIKDLRKAERMPMMVEREVWGPRQHSVTYRGQLYSKNSGLGTPENSG